MFKNNEYDIKDFSKNGAIYKGKERDISLNGWIFDRFLQGFYKEHLDQIISIRYKDTIWELVLLIGANQLLYETYDDLADAFVRGNELHGQF